MWTEQAQLGEMFQVQKDKGEDLPGRNQRLVLLLSCTKGLTSFRLGPGVARAPQSPQMGAVNWTRLICLDSSLLERSQAWPSSSSFLPSLAKPETGGSRWCHRSPAPHSTEPVVGSRRAASRGKTRNSRGEWRTRGRRVLEVYDRTVMCLDSGSSWRVCG
ncbi:hypothetical protein RRG08_011052 [Elysia crispata]|uniref:Uncharacterized protein n=1 Tax=Elysia crispata TaxID=231223 RepID=A0AAE0Z978_9GAST|nr:hypothetical protein RRG08_011052 [Elysia crispata]